MSVLWFVAGDIAHGQTTELRCHFRRLPERFVCNSGLTQALRNLQSSQSEIAIANWAILHAAVCRSETEVAGCAILCSVNMSRVATPVSLEQSRNLQVANLRLEMPN